MNKLQKEFGPYFTGSCVMGSSEAILKGCNYTNALYRKEKSRGVTDSLR